MSVLGSDDLDKTYPNIVDSYDDFVGDVCGCNACNLNDELQCMLCGAWNDGIVKSSDY
jgi:hypothetical protein